MSSLDSVGLFLLSLILVLTFSLLITSLLRLRNLPSYLLSIYLLSITNIIFIGEIAGTIGLLGNKLVFLCGHIGLALIAFLLWYKFQRPSLFHPLKSSLRSIRWQDIKLSFREWPEVWFLGVTTGILYLFGVYLVLTVPPNNWDSMACHMTRIGYWLQHGNFLPWPTWDIAQQIYPLNAQIQMLWTIVFIGWDKLAGFPQWVSALTGMVTIFGFARIFGWSRPQSLFSACIWALLPEVLLQSTTVQNHLMVSTLFVSSVYFFILGIKTGANSTLILSGLALALALGTNQEAFFTLPGLLITAFLVWKKFGQQVSRKLVIWAASAIIAFMAVGSYMYVVNTALNGNPFRPAATVEEITAPISPEVTTADDHNVEQGDSTFFSNQNDKSQEITFDLRSKINASISQVIQSADRFIFGVIKNVPRYFYASFDLTGFPPALADPLYHIQSDIGSYVFSKLSINIVDNGFRLSKVQFSQSEDIAWFGIIGFFLFPGILIFLLFKGLFRKDPFLLGLFFIWFFYLISWAGIIMGKDGTWSIFQGRYHIIMATLLAPFIAAMLRPGRFFAMVSTILVILSFSLAIYNTVNNDAKPLIGEYAIWDLTRIEKQDLVSRRFSVLFNKIDGEDGVPPDATLGLVLRTSFYEYPFFGKTFTRTLIPIYPFSKLEDANWLTQNQIDWILLCQPLPLPQDFVEVFEVSSWGECKLLKRTSLNEGLQ